MTQQARTSRFISTATTRDLLSGKGPHKRREFFYWTDDGNLAGLRYEQWKAVFLQQKAEGFVFWQQPLVQLRLPMLFNLRSDPFERARRLCAVVQRVRHGFTLNIVGLIFASLGACQHLGHCQHMSIPPAQATKRGSFAGTSGAHLPALISDQYFASGGLSSVEDGGPAFPLLTFLSGDQCPIQLRITNLPFDTMISSNSFVDFIVPAWRGTILPD